MIGTFRHDFASAGLAATIAAAVVALSAASVAAQTYGLATMQPGTLANTVHHADRIAPWSFGVIALMRNLASRQLLPH